MNDTRIINLEEADQMPLASLPLAEAHIPMQNWCGAYPPKEGIRNGTAFPCLFRPYEERWRNG